MTDEIIRKEDISSLLKDLPINKLTGIGKKTTYKLAGYGIHSCGQLASFPTAALKKRFGIVGEHLQQMAQGIDRSPVIPMEEAEDAKSIGHSHTTDIDISDREEIQRHMLRLSEMVGRRARRITMRAVLWT